MGFLRIFKKYVVKVVKKHTPRQSVPIKLVDVLNQITTEVIEKLEFFKQLSINEKHKFFLELLFMNLAIVMWWVGFYNRDNPQQAKKINSSLLDCFKEGAEQKSVRIGDFITSEELTYVRHMLPNLEDITENTKVDVKLLLEFLYNLRINQYLSVIDERMELVARKRTPSLDPVIKTFIKFFSGEDDITKYVDLALELTIIYIPLHMGLGKEIEKILAS